MSTAAVTTGEIISAGHLNANTVARNIPKHPNGVVVSSALKGVGFFCP